MSILHPMPFGRRAPLMASAVLALAATAHAGVINPNISIIGQPFTRWTDDAGDPASKRAVLDAGETEIVYDDYLNPYARGFFTLAFGEEGAEVEEGFFTLLRGLPGGLALKGGKYRVGFGRLNHVHYGQQHIVARRSGNSVQTTELSRAFLFISPRHEAWSFDPNALLPGYWTRTSFWSTQVTVGDRASSIWRTHA